MSPTSYRTAPPRVKSLLKPRAPNKDSIPDFKFAIRNGKSEIRNSLVGLGRVELPTSRLSGVRSNQLSYRPKTLLRIPGIHIPMRIFAAKKSHTSHQVRSVLAVDAPEGRVASVAIIACDLLVCRIIKEQSTPITNPRSEIQI